MTATECWRLRIARHRERQKRLEERNELSEEISDDEAEYIEYQYYNDLQNAERELDSVVETFIATT